MDLKKKMTASGALYISHIESVQNVVRLHNSSSDAGLEEISASVSSNASSIEQVGFTNFMFVRITFLLLP